MVAELLSIISRQLVLHQIESLQEVGLCQNWELDEKTAPGIELIAHVPCETKRGGLCMKKYPNCSSRSSLSIAIACSINLTQCGYRSVAFGSWTAELLSIKNFTQYPFCPPTQASLLQFWWRHFHIEKTTNTKIPCQKLKNLSTSPALLSHPLLLLTAIWTQLSRKTQAITTANFKHSSACHGILICSVSFPFLPW